MLYSKEVSQDSNSEEEMEISTSLREAALAVLQDVKYSGKKLPASISSTAGMMFVALATDDSVTAIGVVTFEEVEYKIGFKK